MLFDSLEFFTFFGIVLLLYWQLPRRHQNFMLLGASYLFYGWWNWRYLALLLGSSLADFAASHLIARSRSHHAKRAWLIAALVVNFGVLFVFKYFDFFVDSSARLLSSVGLTVSPRTLRLALPVGISFLTFQEMGYTVDVYRNQIKPARSLWTYLLFVSYFPHLVAGPIQRSGHLLGQLERTRSVSAERVYSGLVLMLWGLFKKVAVADNLGPYVDAVYANPERHSGLSLAFATYLFAFQIYCDFCGYSDMAVGMSRILGIDLIYNFRTPYLATGLREFWRRWHISLSTWFRDYMYIPLGGNQCSRRRDAFNIMVVFLVSGLWHGANWTFVIWGALHGAYLVCERFLAGRPSHPRGIARWLRIAATFNLVTLAWIFFRANSVQQAFQVLRGLGRGGALFWDPLVANGLVGLAILAIVEVAKEPLQSDEWFVRRPAWAQLAASVTLFFSLLLFGSQHGAQFIYFQF